LSVRWDGLWTPSGAKRHISKAFARAPTPKHSLASPYPRVAFRATRPTISTQTSTPARSAPHVPFPYISRARPRRALNGKEATNFDTHVFFQNTLCCRQDIIDQEIEDAAALPCRWTSRVWELEGVHGILRCRVVTHKAQGDLRHLAFCADFAVHAQSCRRRRQLDDPRRLSDVCVCV